MSSPWVSELKLEGNLKGLEVPVEPSTSGTLPSPLHAEKDIQEARDAAVAEATNDSEEDLHLYGIGPIRLDGDCSGPREALQGAENGSSEREYPWDALSDETGGFQTPMEGAPERTAGEEKREESVHPPRDTLGSAKSVCFDDDRNSIFKYSLPSSSEYSFCQDSIELQAVVSKPVQSPHVSKSSHTTRRALPRSPRQNHLPGQFSPRGSIRRRRPSGAVTKQPVCVPPRKKATPPETPPSRKTLTDEPPLPRDFDGHCCLRLRQPSHLTGVNLVDRLAPGTNVSECPELCHLKEAAAELKAKEDEARLGEILNFQEELSNLIRARRKQLYRPPVSILKNLISKREIATTAEYPQAGCGRVDAGLRQRDTSENSGSGIKRTIVSDNSRDLSHSNYRQNSESREIGSSAASVRRTIVVDSSRILSRDNYPQKSEPRGTERSAGHQDIFTERGTLKPRRFKLVPDRHKETPRKPGETARTGGSPRLRETLRLRAAQSLRQTPNVRETLEGWTGAGRRFSATPRALKTKDSERKAKETESRKTEQKHEETPRALRESLGRSRETLGRSKKPLQESKEGRQKFTSLEVQERVPHERHGNMPRSAAQGRNLNSRNTLDIANKGRQTLNFGAAPRFAMPTLSSRMRSLERRTTPKEVKQKSTGKLVNLTQTQNSMILTRRDPAEVPSEQTPCTHETEPRIGPTGELKQETRNEPRNADTKKSRETRPTVGPDEAGPTVGRSRLPPSDLPPTTFPTRIQIRRRVSGPSLVPRAANKAAIPNTRYVLTDHRQLQSSTKIRASMLHMPEPHSPVPYSRGVCDAAAFRNGPPHVASRVNLTHNISKGFCLPPTPGTNMVPSGKMPSEFNPPGKLAKDLQSVTPSVELLIRQQRTNAFRAEKRTEPKKLRSPPSKLTELLSRWLVGLRVENG
eukprot:Gregarina_sp_Poly_1__3460@NODE_2001_length_2885_cov_4_107168_g1292_i0_p1_GENE_NODE_2001_length_2885_cov_4_107168_g1292_i0NODE_2001_length_2885_cov_4_107168_g1292_i0_p1_ORF_typecomplete_len921_score141_40APH_6_hur/PF04655_14/0_54APH_6_hur/PF04655_14/39_NODE_2001_length_2885_cov_4_107168_g1292_i0342796